MHRTIASLMALASCTMIAMAQEANTATTAPHTSDMTVGEAMAAPAPTTQWAAPQADTLALPPLTLRGTIARPSLCLPYVGWGEWPLHQGLNASLSMAAIVGLGSSGGHGFAQSVAMMYADNLAPKLTLGVGAYYSHFNWGPGQYHDAGLNAMLGYRFDEHWEAYLFAQKSIVTTRTPRPLYDWGEFGDKIGAEVRYNFSPSFSVGMSVWMQERP